MLTLEGLENWYVQTVKVKHAFAGTTAPDPIPLPDVTTVDGLLEGIAEESENAFVAAADHSGRHHTDGLAYRLQLPATLYRWYGLKKIGGKTILFNQVVDESTVDLSASDGLTKTLSDHVFSFSGSPSKSPTNIDFVTGLKLVSGHKYLIALKKQGSDSVSRIRVYDYTTNTDIINITNSYGYIIVTASADYTNVAYRFQAIIGMSVSCQVTPMLVDLTLMFGAGNEPTIDGFHQMFPADYYAYNAGELMDAKVTSVVSEDGDGNVIDTINIPAGVQALTGYGFSSPGKTNYIDFENNVFVQNVGRRPYASGDESDATVITDGTSTHYNLTTPVETSVTLPAADIGHETGGSITFENTNKIPVPVNVDYIGV